LRKHHLHDIALNNIVFDFIHSFFKFFLCKSGNKVLFFHVAFFNPGLPDLIVGKSFDNTVQLRMRLCISTFFLSIGMYDDVEFAAQVIEHHQLVRDH